MSTLDRLLAATGARLTVEATGSSPRKPSRADLAWSGRTLLEVLALAEALPAHHDPELHFPRLGARRPAAG